MHIWGPVEEEWARQGVTTVFVPSGEERLIHTPSGTTCVRVVADGYRAKPVVFPWRLFVPRPMPLLVGIAAVSLGEWLSGSPFG